MLTRSLSAPWVSGTRRDAAVRVATPAAVLRERPLAAPWSAPVARDSAKTAPWIIATARDQTAAAPWGPYAVRSLRAIITPWGVATATDRAAAAAWGVYAARMLRSLITPWGIATATDQPAAAPWGAYAVRSLRYSVSAWGQSRQVDSRTPSPWGAYRVRLALAVDVPAEAGDYTYLIPTQRSYIVLNEIELKRVSDSVPIPATRLSLNIDADTWTWGFTASLPGSALDFVIGSPGAPVELNATLNGTQFILLCERVRRSDTFGKPTISISGRGQAAALDAPYTATRSLYSATAITAQQAAIAALDAPDVPEGWSIDWNLIDWLLPAGVWSHQGSPISAVTRIAQAAGGYVQADHYTQTLHVNPRYPLAPWLWGTALIDYEIPAAIASLEAIDWQDKPDYDAIYVSGETGGILARVKKTGSAGSLPAQMITDSLITHADAARQRGLSVLGDTGRIATLSLSMPILSASGVIMPGAMVDYVRGSAHRVGIARSVSIEANYGTARQTVEVECHE